MADADQASDHDADDEDAGDDQALKRHSSTDPNFDYAIPPSLASHSSTPKYRDQLCSTPEEEELASSGDELLTRHDLNRQLSGLTAQDLRFDRRFFGKSSSFMVVMEAADLKRQYLPESSNSSPEPVSKAGLTFPVITDASGVSYLRCGCPGYGSSNPVSTLRGVLTYSTELTLLVDVHSRSVHIQVVWLFRIPSS